MSAAVNAGGGGLVRCLRTPPKDSRAEMEWAVQSGSVTAVGRSTRRTSHALHTCAIAAPLHRPRSHALRVERGVNLQPQKRAHTAVCVFMLSSPPVECTSQFTHHEDARHGQRAMYHSFSLTLGSPCASRTSVRCEYSSGLEDSRNCGWRLACSQLRFSTAPKQRSDKQF